MGGAEAGAGDEILMNADGAVDFAALAEKVAEREMNLHRHDECQRDVAAAEVIIERHGLRIEQRKRQTDERNLEINRKTKQAKHAIPFGPVREKDILPRMARERETRTVGSASPSKTMAAAATASHFIRRG